MPEQVDFSLLHDTMIALRDDIATLRTEMAGQFDEVKSRLTTLEVGQSGILRFIANHDLSIAQQQAALDRLSSRVERIERRLDLSETP